VTACKSALATPPLPDGWQWRFESTNQAGCLFKFSRFDFDDQSPCEYDTVLTLSGTSDTLRAILAVAFGVQLCVAIANMIWTRRVGSREFQRAQTEESSPPKSLYSRPGYAIRLAAQGPGLFYIAISQRRCDLLALVMQLASSAAGAIASVMAVFGAPLTFKTVILWITFASNSVAFLFKLSVALFTRRLWVREHDHLLQTNLFTKKPQTSSVPGQGADTSNRSAV